MLVLFTFRSNFLSLSHLVHGVAKKNPSDSFFYRFCLRLSFLRWRMKPNFPTDRDRESERQTGRQKNSSETDRKTADRQTGRDRHTHGETKCRTKLVFCAHPTPDLWREIFVFVTFYKSVTDGPTDSMAAAVRDASSRLRERISDGKFLLFWTAAPKGMKS